MNSVLWKCRQATGDTNTVPKQWTKSYFLVFEHIFKLPLTCRVHIWRLSRHICTYWSCCIEKYIMGAVFTLLIRYFGSDVFNSATKCSNKSLKNLKLKITCTVFNHGMYHWNTCKRILMYTFQIPTSSNWTAWPDSACFTDDDVMFGVICRYFCWYVVYSGHITSWYGLKLTGEFGSL